MTKLNAIQTELRHQRQDNKDISLKLDKLLIDKHLQSQVDDWFEHAPDEESHAIPPEDIAQDRD